MKSSETHFVKASIRAEMKKSTSYEVDVSLDADGVVQEAQCECGASMDCKHVAAVHKGRGHSYKADMYTCHLFVSDIGYYIKTYGMIFNLFVYIPFLDLLS